MKVEEYVLNSVPTILVGRPGIGKTTMAYLIAKENDMTVIETNASDKRKKEDINEFEKALRTRKLIPTLFLLDEIDGMGKRQQKQLSTIVKKSDSPILMTANDNMKVDLSLKKYCKFVEIKITKMYLRSIVQRMKYIAEKEGYTNPPYNRISLDIRASINSVFEGSHGYDPESNNFGKINNILKHGKKEKIKNPKTNKDETPLWILDNIPNVYNGTDIYKAVKTLGILVETRNDNLLQCFPRSKRGKVGYPHFLRKRSKNEHNARLHKKN